MCFSDSDDRFDTPLDYTWTIFMEIQHFRACITTSHANPSSECNTNINNITWRRLHLLTAPVRGLHLSSVLK